MARKSLSPQARQQQLIEILNHKRGEKVTAQELAEEFQVNEKTIRRDLNKLAELDQPILSDLGNGGGFYMDNTYRLGHLSNDQRSFLYSVAERAGLSEQESAHFKRILAQFARYPFDRLIEEEKPDLPDADENAPELEAYIKASIQKLHRNVDQLEKRLLSSVEEAANFNSAVEAGAANLQEYYLDLLFDGLDPLFPCDACRKLYKGCPLDRTGQDGDPESGEEPELCDYCRQRFIRYVTGPGLSHPGASL